MRRPMHFGAILVFIAVQPTRPQDLSKHDGAAELALHRLHIILREPAAPGDISPHDAYISLIGFANEETLPLLLDRLRLDFGSSEPAVPPGVKLGFVCTQVHLVDAIKSITNTDQGMFYPRWGKWWDANRSYPRLKWILDGFAEGGLNAIDPPDERFGVELIEALADQREYFAINARRLLLRVPAAARASWVRAAATSDSRSRRLGALRDLERIDTSGNDDMIRKMTSDSDQEVRELAIKTLEKRQERKP